MIAKEAHVSLRVIGKILNKVTGDDVANEEEIKQSRHKDLSPYAQAFQMFQHNQPLTEVAINLDKDTDTVLYYYRDYLRLLNMKRLVATYEELKDDLPIFLHLYRRIKKERLTKQDVTDIIEHQRCLKDLDKKVDFYNNHTQRLMTQIIQLKNKHKELTKK